MLIRFSRPSFSSIPQDVSLYRGVLYEGSYWNVFPTSFKSRANISLVRPPLSQHSTEGDKDELIAYLIF